VSAPRTSSRHLFTSAVVACACLLAVGLGARGQNAPAPNQFTEWVARGVELYTKGDFEAATDAFKRATKADKTDPDAWHFLGLSYKQQGKLKDASRAFEKSVVLNFSRLTHNVPASSIEEYKSLTPEERRTRRARLASGYERAAEAVVNYVQLRPENAGGWSGQLESLRFYAKALAAGEGEEALFFAPDVSEKAIVRSRPEPPYTEDARKHQVEGVVRLRMVLASDGSVRHIIVLKALPRGLTESAINAARRIKFDPATKDGRPVSQYTTVEYNFNVY
jgi:TonB family protein